MRWYSALAGFAFLSEPASANIALTACNHAVIALHTVSSTLHLRPDAQAAAWPRITEHLARLRLAQSEIETLRADYARDQQETLREIETLIRTEVTTERAMTD
mgnify:CR=1 FL=1